MPRLDLTQDRTDMRKLAGKSGPLPTYGGPPRPGVLALVAWVIRHR